MKGSILVFILATFLFAKEIVNVNFNNLSINDFIKLSSKILNKNIIITNKIKGKVNLIVNKIIYKDDIFDILLEILKSKGYTIIQDKDNLKIVSLADILSYNLPKFNKNIKHNIIVIKVFNLDKRFIKPFLSKYGKIIETNDKVIVIDFFNNIKTILKFNLKDKIILKTIYLKNINANETKKNLLKISKKLNILIESDKNNNLILFGQQNKILFLEKLISSLDTDVNQVYIKAKIIEINQNRLKDIGLRYNFKGFKSQSNGLITLSSSLNSLVDNNDLQRLSTYGYDLETLKSGISLEMTLNLLKQNGIAEIVSEPSLLCINNKEAFIYIGETRSIKVATKITSGGTINDTYKREDIGLTLKVKPRINGNSVFVDIETKVEDISQSTTNGQPNTTKKRLLTSAIVRNGESIILGGYIKNKSQKTTEKIAFFGDIPYLGALFRGKTKTIDKINLVIIITPYIVPKNKDLSFIRKYLVDLDSLQTKYIKKIEKKESKKEQFFDNNYDKILKQYDIK